MSLLLIIFIQIILGFQNQVIGQTGVIVHLFEWKWDDIANECEAHLGPNGFSGVQPSPAQESLNIIGTTLRAPWWQRWQPVSYLLESLSGNDTQFRAMVQRCNAAGIKVYADIVINQMTGDWSTFEGVVGSTGNSSFDFASQSYPAVPYTAADFNDDNCTSESGTIENHLDADQMRFCKFYGMNDLDQSKPNVRNAIRGYLNNLINIGVAGFRIDSSVNMRPVDLEDIFNSLDDLNTDYFSDGTRAEILMEARNSGGEAVNADEYFHLGRTTEFRFTSAIGEAFRGINGQSISILKYLNENRGFVPSSNALVFVDHYETQRPHHSPLGVETLSPKDGILTEMAITYNLADVYGAKRIMSSYDYTDEDAGAPSDPVCTGDWLCEHRRAEVVGMVGFHNEVQDAPLSNWWDNGKDQIAFARDAVGFIAINNEDSSMSQTLQTSLAAGTYCDVITGSLSNVSCTGQSITVGASGLANINLVAKSHMAIHSGSKVP